MCDHIKKNRAMKSPIKVLPPITNVIQHEGQITQRLTRVPETAHLVTGVGLLPRLSSKKKVFWVLLDYLREDGLALHTSFWEL